MIALPRVRRSQTASATLLRHESIDERVRRLPQRCGSLLGGLDNAEGDAALLFEGLPYADVMAIALRDVAIRRALGQLPAEWDGWAR